MDSTIQQLVEKIEEIEAEMKKIGFWSVDQVHIDPKECKEAFCGDKIPFEQWLQFVFIPAVKKSVLTGELPQESMVGVKATREYDYMTATPQALGLVTLLNEFDGLIND